MNRWFLLFLLSTLIGIGVWQYRVYRTPVLFFTTEEGAGFVQTGVQANDIPSIDAPVFESVAAADQYLDNAGFGLMIERSGQVRFYPFQILVWHEIVHDQINSSPILVTYSPLSAAGVVYDRRIAGEVLEFSVSGLVLDNNTIIADRSTGSYWRQLSGMAMEGERAGQQLESLPSLVMNWDAFKQTYPQGQVLSRQTGFERDYTHNPYGDYETSHTVFYPLTHDDARLPTKEKVVGIVFEEGQVAFSLKTIQTQQWVSGESFGHPLLLVWDPTQQTIRVFSRKTTQGQVLSFTHNAEVSEVFVDDQTGSVWNDRGEAVSGPLRGQQLPPQIATSVFWMVWSSLFPQTELF